MEQYFRVSSEWMKTYGHDNTYGESKVFKVLYAKKSHLTDQSIVVLQSKHMINGEWLVFESRGHFVSPYTLVLVSGLFMPALADVEEEGADLKSNAEYDTFEEAQAASWKMNEAIRKAYADSIPKSAIESIPSGSFIRKLDGNGLPFGKTYRRELFDNEKGKFPIVDPLNPDKRQWLSSGVLVSIDSEDF